jgi:hypothetical protein
VGRLLDAMERWTPPTAGKFPGRPGPGPAI